jgi:LysR family hydrogen peroxide-inducible transcriptional activator
MALVKYGRPAKTGIFIMTLTEMRYIVALARDRHFGKAAESCHVSQPTLSVALKKVEGQLGAALFERAASDVRITALGERIVAQARRVLEEAVRLEEIASAAGDPMTGPLRVGVIYTIAPYLLPKLVPALYQYAPAMPLFLKEDFTANLIPALKAGELDVIVIALPFAEPGLVAQAVYDEPFRVVVPANHSWADRPDVKADELDGQNLLLLGQGNCFRDQVLESCPRLAAPDALAHSLEGGSLETIRYMVASGAGLAVMPSTAADPLIDNEPMVKVLPFSGKQPSRTVGLVWRVTFPRPQAIDAVRAALLSCRLPGATARQ